MSKWGFLPAGAATIGPYDSDFTSSDEAEAPTPEMADRAEKMRRRLSQRTSGAAAAFSSLPSPAPRSTPPPLRNVVDLTPSLTASPSRQPPLPTSESPSSKRPLEQSDAPAPKKIRLGLELDENAQICQGNYSIQNWAEHVFVPKDLEAASQMQDEYILEASLRQSYRNLTFQLELRKQLRGLKITMHSLAARLRQRRKLAWRSRPSMPRLWRCTLPSC